MSCKKSPLQAALFCFCFFLHFSTFAQVSLQTGSSNFSLPMFNWADAGSRLKLDVGLSYSSGNGLKVNDVASNIGQGWNLAAGGVITRLQVGEPDDQQAHGSDNSNSDGDVTKYPDGLLYAGVSGAAGCPNNLTKYPIYKGMNQVYAQKNETAVDRQADYFAFSFNGKSGEFVIGRGGSTAAWVIGDTRLQVTYQTDVTMANNTTSGIRTTIKSFTVTDVDGLIYKFGSLSASGSLTEVSKNCGLAKTLQTQFCDATTTIQQKQPTFKNSAVYNEADFNNNSYVNPWVIGSWYLSEIDDPFTGRKVTFNYVTRSVNNNPAGITITDNQGKEDYVVISHHKSYTMTPEISGITFPDGHSVNVNYQSGDRVDFAGEKAIASIDIKYIDSSAGAAPVNRFLSEYQLNTTYFILNRYGTPSSAYQKSVARLCLKSVRKIGVDLKEDEAPYTFDYYLNSGTGSTDDFIPPPFFYAKDIYGYYNGNNSTAFSGGAISLTGDVTELGFDQLKGLCFLRNGSASPVIKPKANYAQNGLLRQIISPAGGVITYQYGQNIAGTATLDGGVHVIKTSETDGGYSNGCGNPIVTQYNYVMNGPGSASSLWGMEQPANAISVTNYYAPADRRFHFSWSCGACCYWKYAYPGILNQYQSVSLTDFQNFMNAIAPVLTIVGVISDIMDIASVIGGATGVGSIVAVIIDVVGILVNIVISCTGSHSSTTSSSIYYSSNLNDISPLPKQFMRVEVVRGTGGAGKTVETFTSQNDYPVWVPSNPYFAALQRFAPWAYGLPDSTMLYDSTGRLVKMTKNIYGFGAAKHYFSLVSNGMLMHPALTSCKCEVVNTRALRSDNWTSQGANGYTASSNGDMNVLPYDIYTGRAELDTTIERTYSVASPGQYSETKVAYQYNSRWDNNSTPTAADNYDVRQVTSWQSNGDITYKTIGYPGDFNTGTLNTGLVGSWPLNGTASDVSGNNHNGTLYNTLTTTDRFGNAGNAILFNGSSSQITIPDNAALHLNNTDYTITVWVRLDNYNSGLYSAIISRRGALGANQGYLLAISGVNSVHTAGLPSTTGGTTSFNNGSAGYSFSPSVATGQWHMLTVTYGLSGQVLNEYFDGTLYNTYTGAGTLPSTAYDLTIGVDQAANLSNSGGYYFQGAMNDLRLYSRSLSASEIQQLYTNTSAGSGPLYAMLQHNIASVPVESYTWERKGGTQVKYFGEKVSEFSQLPNGDIKVSRELEQRFLQPAATMALYQGPGNSNNPSNYKQTRAYNYDMAGNLAVVQDEGGRVVSDMYDYSNKYLVATVANADAAADNPAYTSFETPSTGGWTLSGTSSVNHTGPAVTGQSSLTLLAGNGNALSSGALNTGKPYTLSFWANNANCSVSTGATLTTSGPVINGFTYYEYAVSQGTSIVKLQDNNASSNVVIDEVRLYPKNARMHTETFDPLVGKTSECDENNRITYYEYDNLGRLRFIEDENKNVQKMYEYNNVSAVKRTGCDATAFNPVMAETFVRSNCGAGYQGSKVTYQVPANKYSGATQSEADSKAEADILVNGPAYANANGACLLVYYNTLKSETDSALYCSAGKKGKLITYSVPAGTYSSLISQAVADSLAMDDVLANAKAYANNPADSNTACIYDTTAFWESGEPAVYNCQRSTEIVQQVNTNPHSPGYGQTQWINVGVGDSACFNCTFTWNPVITNTINGYTSFANDTTSFTYVFMPPTINYSSGTIGQLKGICMPSANRYVTVPDGASNGTRTWQLTFYPSGDVYISLASGPIPNSTTTPIVVIGKFKP